MIKILIVEDNSMCREGIESFLGLCGYYLNVKYAVNFDDAMGYLAERFDIVCCDYFLESTHLSPETGLVFLKKYCGKHGELNTDNDDQIIMLYSGATGEIPKGQGYYIVDRDNLIKELENKIAMIAMKQGQGIQSENHKEKIPMSEQYNQKLCDERHVKLDKSIDRLNTILNRFAMLFIGAIVTSAFAVVLSCIKVFGE
jgi:hypothetical protein